MEPPAHLPRTAEDVEDWSVYADHLLTRGNPLGEQLAYELALPEHPTREQVVAFHTRCRRLPQSRHALMTWCLSHVRTLHIAVERVKLGLPVGPSAPSIDAAMRLVLAPSGRLLEEIEVAVGTEPLAGHARLFAALPPTCTRVKLEFVWSVDDRLDEVLEVLPPQIREVSVAGGFVGRLVSDRFALVDLTSQQRLDDGKLAAALDETATVQVRVGSHRGELHPRLQLGRPGDATLGDDRRTTAVPRWSLRRLQGRYDVVPVRTQLAWLPEYDTFDPRELSCVTAGELGLALRRCGADWTVRYDAQLWIDDEPIEPGRRVPLRDGARLRVADRTIVFAAANH